MLILGDWARGGTRKNEGAGLPAKPKLATVAEAMDDWIGQLQARLTTDQIEAALVGNGAVLAQSALDEAWAAVKPDLDAALAAQLEIGGTKALRAAGLKLAFDVQNPFANAAARNQTASLITEITEETRSAVQTAIGDGFLANLPPRTLAQQIQPLVGLTTRDAKAVQNARARLVDDGATEEQADRAAAKYAARLGKARAVSIARTESAFAQSAGTQAAWSQAQAQGVIHPQAQKRWLATAKSCDVCKEELNGQVVLVTGVFTAGGVSLPHPPAHPGCTCAMVLEQPAE
jgi:hypothetical protein